MQSEPERTPRTFELTPEIKEQFGWRHRVELLIEFAMPGDTVTMPDHESRDYAIHVAMRTGHHGIHFPPPGAAA